MGVMSVDGRLFEDEGLKAGPVFTATYDSDCSVEGDLIQEGDSIRADGEGGYAHASCLRNEQWPVIWE